MELTYENMKRAIESMPKGGEPLVTEVQQHWQIVVDDTIDRGDLAISPVLMTLRCHPQDEDRAKDLFLSQVFATHRERYGIGQEL